MDTPLGGREVRNGTVARNLLLLTVSVNEEHFRSMLRHLRLARCAEQLLARAVEGDVARVGGVAAVARPAAFDGDDGADLQRVPRPSEPDETGRAAELPAPVGDLAGFVHDVDVEPRVWIGPLDL